MRRYLLRSPRHRPLRARSRVAAVVVVVSCAVSLAVGGAGLTVTTPAEAAITPACTTPQLVVWINAGAGSGAAGSTFFKLVFTNLSSHTCTLTGFPGVSAVNLAGRQVGHSAGRETPATGHTITLTKDASAQAVLRIVDAENYPASTCHIAMAAGLRVYPPGQKRSRIVPFPFQACASTGPRVLSVRAVASR
jgi:hypothetical protein